MTSQSPNRWSITIDDEMPVLDADEDDNSCRCPNCGVLIRGADKLAVDSFSLFCDKCMPLMQSGRIS